MALLPNTPFTEGQVWSPELAYESFQAPYFDDQPQYLGHRQRILDTELSNTAGQLKQRFNAAEQALLVSVNSGLVLSYQSGQVMLPGGVLMSIASGLVSAPDNATSYVYVDELGVVKCGLTPSVINLLLAQVVTVGGQVSSLQDWRKLTVKRIQPRPDAIKVFGGTNTTDLVATQGQIFPDGSYQYRDFTVPTGVTITVDRFARFHCSGKVTIDGTIIVTPMSAGATGYGTRVYGYQWNVGGYSGSGAGAGSGAPALVLSGDSGNPYSYAAQPYGSGGGLGFATVRTSPTDFIEFGFGPGGAGGGGLVIEAYRDILVRGVINAKGSNASPWEININGNNGSISGSGGGSGGLILLSSLVAVNIVAGATLNVKGGDGAAGWRSGAGGGGGGGGQIVLMSPTNNTTGATLTLSGGLEGTGGVATLPYDISGGGGGGFGGAGGRSNGAAAGAGKLILRNFIPNF